MDAPKVESIRIDKISNRHKASDTTDKDENSSTIEHKAMTD